jgi:hypothetical protein
MFNAHIAEEGHTMERDIFERKKQEILEVLRTIRKPGRFAFQRTTSIGPLGLRLQYEKLLVQ